MAYTEHTLYDNFVIETKMNDLLLTKINARNLMTVDDSLTAAEGTQVKIHTYTYDGKVEKVAKGAGNSTKGTVSFTAKPYDVVVSQQTMSYLDEDAMIDSNVVSKGLEGMAMVMTNDITTKFFAECAKATASVTVPTDITYDLVVDAVAKMDIEDESGLFLVIGNDQKAAIRKDPDFKTSMLGEIIHSGQIGTIAGIPVVVSKACPKKTGYVMTKEAITLFVKKENQVEQDRNIETRENTIVFRTVNVVALTDETKIVKLANA